MKYKMEEKNAKLFTEQLLALDIPWKVDYDSSTDMYNVEILPVDKQRYLETHPGFEFVFDD